VLSAATSERPGATDTDNVATVCDHAVLGARLQQSYENTPINVAMSVRLSHVKEFSINCMVGSFIKICRDIQILNKIGQPLALLMNTYAHICVLK
jgi:hypothetical protein